MKIPSNSKVEQFSLYSLQNANSDFIGFSNAWNCKKWVYRKSAFPIIEVMVWTKKDKKIILAKIHILLPKDWSEKNGTDIFDYYPFSIIGTMYYYTNFKNIGS